MKKTKIITGLLVTLLLTLALALPAVAQVEPPVVKADLAPGESMTVIKEVTTSAIPPNPDIYFMCDTTASMGPIIEAMKANAGAIMAQILAVQPSAQFGVGNYKDFPYDPYAFQHQQAITADTVAVSAAIAAWAASGGYDWPEGQFYALDRLADGTGIGWREIGTEIVVWLGDAPAHDPVPNAATGLGYDITEATVTADLVAAGIKVIAISWDSGDPSPYRLGLDDDPNVLGGDYAAFYGIVEDGTPGQASRIAAATGGAYLFAATPQEAVEAILDGIEQLTTDVWWEVVECDPGLTVELEPAVYYDVPGDTTVQFAEYITVAEDAPQCETLTATVIFYANEYPEEGVVIGEQQISIHVVDITPPEVWCIESVNPHGKTVPPAGKTTLPGPKGGQNEDGFYQLLAEDNCDPEPEIYVSYIGADPMLLFGPFDSGIVVKITEDPEASPFCKKMGSSKGQAGAVAYHIRLPSDPVIYAVDASGNMNRCQCLVPPPPK
ncbi:MAG: hypothetical protein E3J42_05760 [Dehalococcoidia bacterium]|nr:MAG: hypothetical protein E3J42_05760 [Dehalococcoidia bacterium]